MAETTEIKTGKSKDRAKLRDVPQKRTKVRSAVVQYSAAGRKVVSEGAKETKEIKDEKKLK